MQPLSTNRQRGCAMRFAAIAVPVVLGMLAAAPARADVFINEIHYDNVNTDVSEKVEVLAPAGTSLAGWSVVLYNGSNGTSYATLSLSGTVANQCNGYGTATVAVPGIQNGAPDGLALVNASGALVQLLSYEGTFTATNGPAAGHASTAIPQSETSSTPTGTSLQLAGTGSHYADFSWQASRASSFGACNTGQTPTGGTGGGGGGGPAAATCCRTACRSPACRRRPATPCPTRWWCPPAPATCRSPAMAAVVTRTSTCASAVRRPPAPTTAVPTSTATTRPAASPRHRPAPGM